MKLNLDNVVKFSAEEHKYTAKINGIETTASSTTTILGATGVAPDFSKGNQKLISFSLSFVKSSLSQNLKY